jgi:hypothetical protein
MNALQRLKAAVSMKPAAKTLELPNGEEFEFWMSPLTLAERAKAQKQAKSEDATDFALQLLVTKARDKNGVPMFTQGDLADLRNSLPASLVESLMLMLVGEQELDEDEEELDMKSAEAAADEGQPPNGGTRRSRKAS